MGIITYNNTPSTDIRLIVENKPNYEIAERNVENIQIPGRNGDVLIDHGTYKNVIRKYNIVVEDVENGSGDFVSLSSSLASWLMSGNKYSRLEDSYTPDYYMLAYCRNTLEVLNMMDIVGRATIEFERKPQRFLKIGERAVQISNGETLYNPTVFKSKPIFIIKGTGTVTINAKYTIKVVESKYGSVTVNCDIKDVYKDGINLNSSVELPNGFPVLDKGKNIISYSSTITSVSIVPNWWTL